MTWTNFLLTLAVIYVVYYGFNILYDLLNSNKKSTKGEVVSLTFKDDIPVKDVNNLNGHDNVQHQTISKEEVDKGETKDEVLTTNERKEEEQNTPIPVTHPKEEPVTLSGKVKVIADAVVSGGINYDELLNKAINGAIARGSQIDFGEA